MCINLRNIIFSGKYIQRSSLQTIKTKYSIFEICYICDKTRKIIYILKKKSYISSKKFPLG